MYYKIYRWTLKDKTVNFYSDKQLENFVGRALPIENGFEVQDRSETTINTVKSIEAAIAVLTVLTGGEQKQK